MVKAAKDTNVKERGVSSFDTRLNATKVDSTKKSVTTKPVDKNALNQHSYRCTDDEFKELTDWVEDMTDLSGKKGRGITHGTLIRALISLRPKINDKQLLSALRANM
jgi:hypothetical protein